MLCQAQSTTTEALSEKLCASIDKNNSESFLNLVLPKDQFLSLMKESAPEGVTEEMKTGMIKRMDANYDQEIVEAYRMNFTMVQMLADMHSIGLEGLKFEEVEQKEPTAGPGVSVFHAAIDHEQFKHMYYFARNYKGNWYLAAPIVQISEKEQSF